MSERRDDRGAPRPDDGGGDGAWSGSHPEERLSLLVDGELDGRERRRVRRHVEGCARCREVLDDLEALAARASDLPDRGPDRDLWPTIASEIASGAGAAAGEPGGEPADGRRDGAGGSGGAVVSLLRRQWRVSVPRLAAAAALVAALASGVTWSVTRGEPGGGGVSGPAPTALRPGSADAGAAGPDGGGVRWASLTSMPRGVAELEARYREARERLDPATRRTVERNLRLIDRAIAEAQRALGEHPRNSYLHRHLTRTVQRKAELLATAVRVSQSD